MVAAGVAASLEAVGADIGTGRVLLVLCAIGAVARLRANAVLLSAVCPCQALPVGGCGGAGGGCWGAQCVQAPAQAVLEAMLSRRAMLQAVSASTSAQPYLEPVGT